ncbi:DNA-binding protein [Streptomyces mobaraensis]|uniref:DNA-binding protein n=1 Tax=Streptomyces mobaraensis TaxID=35621 RepID=UPI0033187F04
MPSESPLLVTEDQAAAWTGRAGATIRSWAHEGRITRHGTGWGRVRYNLWELPQKTTDEDGVTVLGPPPSLPEQRTAA